MKKLLVFAFAFTIAICLAAFAIPNKSAVKEKKQTTTYMWFDFSGTSESDYENLSLYTQDPTHASPCSGNGVRCEIYAPVISSGPNAGKPDLTDIVDETKRP